MRAARGGMWVVGGKLGDSVLRFAANVVLARLLFPEAFGLMLLVNVFLMGLQLFSDTGVGPCIIRSKRGEEDDFLRTAWTIQCARGMLLWGLCWLLAPLWASLFGHPELAELIPIAGLSALFLGFRSPHWSTADRKLLQGRKTLILVASQFASFATMVTWALVDPTVWALVGGGLAGTFSQFLLSHLLLPGVSMRPRWEPKAAQEIWNFGRWIFLSTALTFLATQADRLVLGGSIEAGPLGLFGIAFSILATITTLVNLVSSSVAYPAWTEAHRTASVSYASTILRSRAGLQAIATAGLIFLATLAPTLFRVLYDERYASAATIVQYLCLPVWLEILFAFSASALLVHGDSKSLSGANALVLLLKFPACWIGLQWGGLPGFILGATCANGIGLMRIQKCLYHQGVRTAPQDFLGSLRALAYVGIGIAASLVFADLHPWLDTGLSIAFALSLALYAARPARKLLFASH